MTVATRPARGLKITGNSRDGDAGHVAAQMVTGHIERAMWTDPEDARDIPREIHGYRRVDPLLTLHLKNGRDVTKQHLAAVDRLRTDYEIGELGLSGKGSGGDTMPSDGRLDALGRYRAACQALGPSLCAVLLPVALLGWTVKRWAEGRGIEERKAGGYLIAAMDRLDDHYNPTVKKSA